MGKNLEEIFIKIYALYFSPTGTTKKVIDIICSPWNCEKLYFDLSDTTNSVLDITFEENDICVVATPSFSGRVPQFIIPKLQKLCGNKAKAILITTYGNRAYDDTLIELKNTMEGSGFLCISAVASATRHSVIPKYGAGRPDSRDAKELKEISIRCKNAIEHTVSTVRVPGNMPYRKYLSIPVKPKINNKCIGCGLCSKKCPVQAIPLEHLNTTDKEKCISCMQCITLCPKKARYISCLVRKIAEIKMRKLCDGRKSNEFFV